MNPLPASITTPDSLETRVGTLEFKEGAPNAATVEKVYDFLDYMHGVEAYSNAHQSVSTYALMKGLQGAGIPNNSVIIFSELTDSSSLYLTANADTVYYISVLDVTQGPLAPFFDKSWRPSEVELVM